MPVYDYKCKECGKKFTVTQTLKDYDSKKTKCPKCGSRKVEQLVSAFFAVTSKKS
ncbi:MAG: zinc ribbon domain-containing protein [Acidobacteria bacterium]|nr:zinc ribbon domain-containing protein [Acidobacteriota bacterium]